MESQRNEEAGTAEAKEEINKDMLFCSVTITHTEFTNAENVYTMINTKLDLLRHKIIKKVEDRGYIK